MSSVIILHIAFASIALLICVLYLIISFRRKKDLLFLASSVASVIIFLFFSLAVIVSESPNTQPPFLTLRIMLVGSIVALSALIGVIYHLANDGRKIYIIVNSSVFWILIFTAVIIPEYVLFGEHAATYRFQKSEVDSFLRIVSGFTLWRGLMNVTIVVFIVSAYLILRRNLKNQSFTANLLISLGMAGLVITGLYDHLVDLGYFNSIYILQYAGFGMYIILSYLTFERVFKEFHNHEKIADNEARWQRLINNTDLVVVQLNRMGHVEYLNPYFYEITGYTKQEVIGKDWFEFIIPPKNYYDVQGAFVEVLAFEFHPYYENPILTKSKEEKMIRWFNIRMRDKSGAITGSLSIGVDISGDVKEKEAIRRKLIEAENLIIALNEKIEHS